MDFAQGTQELKRKAPQLQTLGHSLDHGE